MNKKVIAILLSSIMGLVIAIAFSLHVSAAENQNGGQVVTEGIVTFYEDTTKPTDETTTTTTDARVTKPVGRYPNTGEMIKASIGLSGLALVAMVLFLFFKQRNKEQEADR